MDLIDLMKFKFAHKLFKYLPKFLMKKFYFLKLNSSILSNINKTLIDKYNCCNIMVLMQFFMIYLKNNEYINTHYDDYVNN